MQYVYSPTHWLEITQRACKSFQVHEMTSEHFLKFDYLTSLIIVITKRKKAVDGEKIRFKEGLRFRFDSLNFDKMQISYSYNNDVFSTVNLAKRGKIITLKNVVCSVCNLGINKNKNYKQVHVRVDLLQFKDLDG